MNTECTSRVYVNGAMYNRRRFRVCTVAEHCGRAGVGRLDEPTTEHGRRRRVYGSGVRQVHTVHADIERQKRRDRSRAAD